MEKTCGTCKYWGVKTREERVMIKPNPIMVNQQLDEIQRIKKEYGVADCDRILHTNGGSDYNKDGLKDYLDELAGVEDGSGFHATLCCREQFGCVLWEEK
jgi:hypothetical protein